MKDFNTPVHTIDTVLLSGRRAQGLPFGLWTSEVWSITKLPESEQKLLRLRLMSLAANWDRGWTAKLKHQRVRWWGDFLCCLDKHASKVFTLTVYYKSKIFFHATGRQGEILMNFLYKEHTGLGVDRKTFKKFRNKSTRSCPYRTTLPQELLSL